jgi:hypothetical protein
MESRSTFRKPADEIAYQRQCRDRYEGEPAPTSDLDLSTSIVRQTSRKIAQQIILKYEWLGTLPNNANRFYGIFFGPYCAGVSCVHVGGGGANINAHKEWGVEPGELAYLSRGACVHWAPPGTNSRLTAVACRLLSKETSAKLVIAYADTDAGEIGTIYQACGWTYVGRGSATQQWIAPNGRVYDQKHPSNLRQRFGGTREEWVKALIRDGWKRQWSNPKHRYVKVLDTKDQRLLDLVRERQEPYPKRDRPVEEP